MSLENDAPANEGIRTPTAPEPRRARRRRERQQEMDDTARGHAARADAETRREEERAQRVEHARLAREARDRMNADRVSRYELIAAKADEQQDRQTEDWDGEAPVRADPSQTRAAAEPPEDTDDTDAAELEAARAEADAEAERQRLDAEANERAAREEQGHVQGEDAPHTPSAPRRYKVKVNGQEREIDERELIAGYQKVASADEY